MLTQGLWEEVVVEDFVNLRGAGRDHRFMAEIEKLFKPTTAQEAQPATAEASPK
jgi:hypothetical protein